ncbi:hypothetical protein DSV84_00960 [Campylobacter coli]
MRKKSVVLLGGSTFFMKNGIQKGMQDYIDQHNQSKNKTYDLELYNFSLSASCAIHSLFALKNNYGIIQNSELIVINTNISICGMYYQNFSLDILMRNYEALCKELAILNIKILVITNPIKGNNKDFDNKINIVNKLIYKKTKEYGFNHIDMQRYYEENYINEFFKTSDPFHQLGTIMQVLGKNILKNIDHFKQNTIRNISASEYLIKSPLEIFDLKEDLEYKCFQNSAFKKDIYKLNGGVKLKFKNEYQGYTILGIGVCNCFEQSHCSFMNFILENQKNRIVKKVGGEFYLLHAIEGKFCIDKQSFMYIDLNNEKPTESSVLIDNNLENTNNILHCGLNIFFLAKLDSDLIEAIDLKVLADENIEIAEKYNFSHLIPPVKFYKELIEEYCMRMDPIKYASLPKYAISAKQRIQNHLSYKLGSALIENSKSILGYIRMPFVLSYIRDKHKKDQLAYEAKMKKNPKLTLPPLTSYLDYKEALKEKECFTYKLGEAFIKAYKAWYKGGWIKFIFNLLKLKRI